MSSSPRTIFAALVLTLSTAIASAQTYTVLYSFAGGTDGANPFAPVTLDPTTGNLYGTTLSGGTGSACGRGCGTVFELTSAGVESVLHRFVGSPLDGAGPWGSVLLDAEGNLFGTTSSGGAYGHGTVFKIDPNGLEIVLYSFEGGADGDDPTSGLIQDPNTGDFYGVTGSGGAYGWGTLYEITAAGIHTVLYSFGDHGTGIDPAGKVVQDGKTGNLYGMLVYGDSGCGALFQYSPSGVETELYVFREPYGCQSGLSDPGLVMDAQGNLFGTTSFGGNGNRGVVFRLTAGGVEKVIHRFRGAKQGDGIWPYAGVALDESTGNLYGTTQLGGTGPCIDDHMKGCGTVFELMPPTSKHSPWNETILHSFAGGDDGYTPLGGLARDSQTGNLYGTAVAGGAYGEGVVFEVTP